MRLWDDEILMGWYTADDQGPRSKGTLCLVLDPDGQSMTGRWVGLSHDGAIVTGWACIAKTTEQAQRRIHELNPPLSAR